MEGEPAEKGRDIGNQEPSRRDDGRLPPIGEVPAHPVERYAQERQSDTLPPDAAGFSPRLQLRRLDLGGMGELAGAAFGGKV